MEALKYYRASAKEDPSFRPAFNNLGTIYSEIGKPDLALGFYKQALDLGEDASVYFNMGSELFRLERYEESAGYLKKALGIDRRLLRAHLLLGYLYGKMEKPDRSEIYFRNSLKLDPENKMAALGLCVLLEKEDRNEEALELSTAFLKIFKENASFKNMRAGLLLKLNRVDDSLSEYKELAKTSDKFTSFSSLIEKARGESSDQYNKLFSGMSDKISLRTEKLKKKISSRKTSGTRADETEKKDDMKDLVDLSLLHLFNGDSDKALHYLFQAKKIKGK